MCPRCRQNAPLVYRGLAAYCTACGALRMPLTENSVNLAGQGSKIGGTLARIVGWLVLGGGLLLGLMLLAILQAIFPAGFAGFIVGGGIAALSVVLAIVFLRGGKSLQAGGDDQQRDAHVRALFAMAPVRGGIVRAIDAAPALSISTEAADALLTDLAKTRSDFVSLEFDDQGQIYYRIDPSGRVRMRVDVPLEPVRVATSGSVDISSSEENARDGAARRSAK